MGFLDPKQYLTGNDENPGAVSVGEVFKVLNARINGEVTVRGRTATEAKLLISTDTHPEPFVVFTTGAAIVNQIQRLDAEDRAAMQSGGITVKLGTKDTGKGNPANLLVKPDDPTEQGITTTAEDDAPDF